jgi:hypothetical protein
MVWLLKGENMSKYLIDEMPLVLMPTLAKNIGLNESIVVQQVHYWLTSSKHEHENRKWIFNTYEEWNKQFPFWSNKTLRRIFANLVNNGILITGNFNKLGFDRTIWYTICYEKLSEFNGQNDHISYGQNDHMDKDNMTTSHLVNVTTSDMVNMTTPITRYYTDNNTDNINTIVDDKITKSKERKIEYAEFVKMTEKEYEVLLEKYGKEKVDKMIEVLDNYKGSNNKKYASDYRAILNWVVERVVGKDARDKKPDEGKYKFDF